MAEYLSTEEEVSRLRQLQSVLENIAFLRERLDSYLNPEKAPIQTVRDLQLQLLKKRQLEAEQLGDITDKNRLQAYKDTQEWYLGKGVQPEEIDAISGMTELQEKILQLKEKLEKANEQN